MTRNAVVASPLPSLCTFGFFKFCLLNLSLMFKRECSRLQASDRRLSPPFCLCKVKQPTVCDAFDVVGLNGFYSLLCFALICVLVICHFNFLTSFATQNATVPPICPPIKHTKEELLTLRVVHFPVSETFYFRPISTPFIATLGVVSSKRTITKIATRKTQVCL